MVALATALTGCAERTASVPRDLRSASCRPESVAVDLRSVITAMHARNRVPGISAAALIPSRWTTPVAVAVGVTALSGGRPLTVDDRFLAGSVGKTFFAALALRRSAEGHFPLDSPLVAFIDAARLPSFRWITPRMLLSHTSGLGEYDVTFMTSLVREPLRVRTTDDWLDVLRRNPPKRRDVGRFRYSDLNFVVLAMALDARSSESAYASIERAYLRPLDLSATSPSVSTTIPRLVTGYDGAAGMFGRDAMLENGQLLYNPQFEWGGGGFVSRPVDLARWISAIRHGHAFPAALWPEVIAKPEGIPRAERHWIGMGLHVDSVGRGVAFGHSGYMPGYVTWMRWYEAFGISLAIQTNASDSVRLVDDGYGWMDSVAFRVGARCGVGSGPQRADRPGDR